MERADEMAFGAVTDFRRDDGAPARSAALVGLVLGAFESIGVAISGAAPMLAGGGVRSNGIPEGASCAGSSGSAVRMLGRVLSRAENAQYIKTAAHKANAAPSTATRRLREGVG